MAPRFGSARSVAAQAIWLSLASAAAQILVAVMYVAAARASAAAAFGATVSAIALGTALVGFLDFGSNAFSVRELARGRMQDRDFLVRAAVKIALAWILGIAWIGISLLVIHSTLWVAGIVGAAVLTNQTAQVFLRGHGKGDAVAATVILERVVAVVALAAAWLLGVAPLTALSLALPTGALASAVVAYLWGRPPGERGLRFRLSNPWRGSSHFGFGVAAQTGQSFDLPLLGLVGGPVAAALYGAVNRWTQPMGLLANAFSSALTPYVAQSGSIRAAAVHIRRAGWLLALAVLACIGVIVVAPFVVTLLVGEQYSGAASVLQLLALGTIPAVLNQPLAASLQALGHERAVAVFIASGVALQLVLVWALGAWAGALGAAIAFCVLQVLLLAALGTLAWSAHRGGS